ncbi:tRNA pseudouridine(55) synthase TruB [Candidatus Peregrinibacteria bacterium CG10_big_fil_rev_8_21_14_0_10_55_24]|nr:MAG: tRNA pseudouridine(55) synthase TruB [Candidatus Peregrinibacteria bacterium CG10_big_fil_rev_8_21_14_0_10_55_24]
MRHGFLLIAKPVGPTSHDCVAHVRTLLCERKIGHLGTLDPAAEGLLVLAVGAKALKVIELFADLSKEYTAQVCLGTESTTYDREGVLSVIPPKPGWQKPQKEDIERVIRDRFLGTIEQTPPAYSAIKVAGERAYRKMRQGRGVDLPPRTVEITACDVLAYRYPDLTLRVACGSGTYIRSLAHDLGKLLRCGGYLSGLQRTKVGDWNIEDAVAPDRVAWGHVLPLKDVLVSCAKIELTQEQAEDIRHGRDIPVEVKPDTIAWCDDLPIALLIPSGEGNGMAHARKVL